MHTLALLDIKVKEPTEESLARGKPVYMEPRFMSVSVAAQQLLEAEEAKKGGVLTEDANCIALARVGAKDQKIVAGTLREFVDIDMGEPLHSFVICGELQVIEDDMFKLWTKHGK